MIKVLVIEDDLVMRENTQELLELSDYRVEVAENGRVGVEKAISFKPDVIVCDIMMPELDGYQVLDKLSDDPATNKIPFIFLTAKAEKSEVRRGMSLGADDYLTKPFEETDLIQSIETRVEKSKKLNSDFDPENLHSSHITQLKKLFEDNNDVRHLKLKKKENLFLSADPVEYFYYIVKGSIKTLRSNDDGKEYTTNLYNEGDYFDIKAIFGGSHHINSAISMDETELLAIYKKSFLDEIFKDRLFMAYCLKELSLSLDEGEEKLISMAYDSVVKRTANILVDMYSKFDKPDSDELVLKVSREDLASVAGTAVETVIRSLKTLKTKGLIEVKGRAIKILSIQGLKEIN